MGKLITVFENKTENIDWELPYTRESVKTFLLRPGQKYEFENSGDESIYAPYQRITARQIRKEEEEFRFHLDLKEQKGWEEPARNPQGFYTEFRNNGQHQIQNFFLDENLLLRVPFGIPVTIDMDPMANWAKFEVIEVREISRRIWINQGDNYVDARSKNFYILRSEDELKRLFETRKKIGENILSREFLKYS